jgi:hypothetical protein
VRERNTTAKRLTHTTRIPSLAPAMVDDPVNVRLRLFDGTEIPATCQCHVEVCGTRIWMATPAEPVAPATVAENLHDGLPGDKSGVILWDV